MNIQEHLNQPFMYGGEIWPLGKIIKDLEAKAMNPRAVSCYIMGLTLGKRIRNAAIAKQRFENEH